jgi:FkbM family methyltransferase
MTPAYTALRECRHGLMLYFKNDVYIGRSLELYGEYSEAEVELFSQLVQPGMTVVEVGANIGTHTVFLAKQVGEAGRVIAFEPQRWVYQVLCANVALNELKNVHAFQMGAGARSQEMNVPLWDPAADTNVGGVSLGNYDGGVPCEPVSVAPLDDLNISPLHFLKVDAEGMEHDILEGAVRTLRASRPILYLENDRKEKSPALLELLFKLDYQAWWHLPPLYNPANFRGNGDNVFPGIVSANVLAIPREKAASLSGFVPILSVWDWCL